MNEVVRRRQMKALYRRFYTWLRHANTYTNTPINNTNNSDNIDSCGKSNVYNPSHPLPYPSSSSPAAASKVDTAGANSLLPTPPLPPSQPYDKGITATATATVGIDNEKAEIVKLLGSYLDRKNASSVNSNSYNSSTTTNPINNHNINTSATQSSTTPLRVITSQDAYTIIQYELRLLSQQCESLEARNKVLLGQLGDRQMADKVLEQVYAYLTRETSSS